MGMVRKNAADIKMAVDAIELGFERDYITTFVLGTGDSDFTPLVHKLRELNRRVIGIGVEASTSALLPPACDEFLFYERLEGVEPGTGPRARRAGRGRAKPSRRRSRARAGAARAAAEETDLDALVTRTLAGLERSSGGPVLASMLKRAILRKDPTFSEADYGFRGFGELLRNLEDRGVVGCARAARRAIPRSPSPTDDAADDDAFALLRRRRAARQKGRPHLSGLKTQVRKREPDFSEKRFGYGGFLQFVKAARARGLLEMDRDDATTTTACTSPEAGARRGEPLGDRGPPIATMCAASASAAGVVPVATRNAT